MHTGSLPADFHCGLSVHGVPSSDMSHLRNCVPDCHHQPLGQHPCCGNGEVHLVHLFLQLSGLRSENLSRLFYLFEDTVITFMKEETFFACLVWLHPALSGIIVSILFGESSLSSEQSLTCSFCSKIPILWAEFNGSIVKSMFYLSHFACNFLTFVTQILVIKRRRQLEKQRAEGIMMVTYSKDGVTISRRFPHEQSCHKLSRHNRTVVTPRASLVSFLFSFHTYLVGGIQYYIMGHSGLPLIIHFLIFTTFSQLFFLHSLIETAFSPNLRNSLTDLLPCWRREYPVIVINV